MYHIQLLNDLHNWFPELLYNSQRFQNVQDVLGYIIQVANQNSYQMNQQRYNTYQYQMGYQSASYPSTPIIHSSAPVSASASSVPAFTSSNRSTSRSTGGIFDLLFNDHSMEYDEPAAHIHISHISPQPADNLLSSILGQVLYGRRDTTAMQNFLNQTVVVRPSAEQINSSTVVNTAAETQDDNCAICQDEIEQGQDMRTINHCHHIFHKHCIDTWFETNVRCPTCRHDIRGGHHAP